MYARTCTIETCTPKGFTVLLFMIMWCCSFAADCCNAVLLCLTFYDRNVSLLYCLTVLLATTLLLRWFVVLWCHSFTALFFTCFTARLFYCFTILPLHWHNVLLLYCVTILLVDNFTALLFHCFAILLCHGLTALSFYSLTPLLNFGWIVLPFYCFTRMFIVSLLYCSTGILFYCSTALLLYRFTELLIYRFIVFVHSLFLWFLMLHSYTIWAFYRFIDVLFHGVWALIVFLVSRFCGSLVLRLHHLRDLRVYECTLVRLYGSTGCNGCTVLWFVQV